MNNTPITNEAQLQAACHRWFNATFPDLRGLGWMNHNDGEKRITAAVADKARGLVKGVPDWCLMVPKVPHFDEEFVFGLDPDTFAHGLFVEFKFGKGQLSPDQERIIEKLRGQGYRVEVIRTLPDFQQLLTDYLR